MKLAAVIPLWLDRSSIEALEVAHAADDAGLEEVWVGEMVTFDAFALAGAIAQRTPKITIVCGPLPVGVRSSVALALGVTSITVLGGRPAHLALGASTPIVVEGWHERTWKRTAERAAHVLDGTRSLLQGERLNGFRLRDPAPETEVRVAAFGPRMLDVAAGADGVVVNLLTPPAVAEIKRRIGETPLAAWVPAAYEPGPATYDQLRRQLAVYLPQPGYAEVFAQAGFEGVVDDARRAGHPKAIAELIGDDLVEAICAIGDETSIQARFAEYSSAGVDTLCVVPATADDPGGEKVLRSVAGFRL